MRRSSFDIGKEATTGAQESVRLPKNAARRGTCPARFLTETNTCSYSGWMVQRQYEARCVCGNRWRVYRTRTEDEEDDDPMATCINCGAATFDLTDIGEVRSAGRDMPT